MSLSIYERYPFDPIREFVNYYGSQEEYLTRKKDSKGWLITPQKFTDFINDYLTKPSHPETLLQLKPLRQNWKARLAAKEAPKKKRDYWFVTISPPEHIPVEKIKQTMERIQKWSCWQEFIGVIEQRSVDEKNIYGIHIHFLGLKSNQYADSNVKQRIDNYKKKYNTLPVRVDETFAPDKQDYFFEKYGKTAGGQLKSDVMKIDIIFRKNENIPRYYGEKMKFS